MTTFNIKVVSDTVCPWCYVGHRQLDTAIELWKKKYPNSQDTFKIDHQPYQLMPEAPRGPGGSRTKESVYEERFPKAFREAAQVRLKQAGAQLGINFSFGGNTGNTRDSHRLVELAKTYGGDVEAQTVYGLFEAYFEKEKDITQYEVLREIGKAAGVPEADFDKAIVGSDEFGPEVDRLAESARQRGVNGVPDFTIQDRFSWSGARDPEAFVSILEKVKEMEASS